MLNYKVIGKRNPILHLLDFDIKIQTIGDPHLGRVFKTGVKSNKLGLRENLVLESFKNLLNPTDSSVNYVVILGDLFDKAIVTPTVLNNAYSLIYNACITNTHIQYRIVSGNHDLSKDSSIISSYQILVNMLELSNLDNLKITLNEPICENISKSSKSNFYLYFDCYNPFNTCKFRQSAILPSSQMVSFGHWDTFVDPKSWNPSSDLISSTCLFVSGHEHLPFYKKCFNTPYICSGSMQPYSHAEDTDGDMYLTIDSSTLDFNNLPDFSNKNIRLLVPKNYVLPKIFECLSLTYKLLEVSLEVSNDQDISKSISNTSDFNTLFLSTIVENNLLNQQQLEQLLNIIANKTYLSDT